MVIDIRKYDENTIGELIVLIKTQLQKGLVIIGEEHTHPAARQLIARLLEDKDRPIKILSLEFPFPTKSMLNSDNSVDLEKTPELGDWLSYKNVDPQKKTLGLAELIRLAKAAGAAVFLHDPPTERHYLRDAPISDIDDLISADKDGNFANARKYLKGKAAGDYLTKRGGSGFFHKMDNDYGSAWACAIRNEFTANLVKDVVQAKGRPGLLVWCGRGHVEPSTIELYKGTTELQSLLADMSPDVFRFYPS